MGRKLMGDIGASPDRAGLGALFQPAQEGVVADGEPDASGEPFPGPSAECVPDQPRDDRTQPVDGRVLGEPGELLGDHGLKFARITRR